MSIGTLVGEMPFVLTLFTYVYVKLHLVAHTRVKVYTRIISSKVVQKDASFFLCMRPKYGLKYLGLMQSTREGSANA